MPVQGYTSADLARLRSVQVRRGGWTTATRDLWREHKDADGNWVKVIYDQAGNRVRMRRTGQDARIFLPNLRIPASAVEVR